MFPINTIIAWIINDYHEQRNIIITNLLLPLGHISNIKGVVNPFKIVCKVRSEGGKCNEVKSVRLKIWCGVDPGGHSVN